MGQKTQNVIILVLSTAILLFLSFNRHSRGGYFNYHSELMADKAGYYVYLPAALKYDFNPNLFPDSIDVKTGNGFLLDFKNQKVRTKYTYGVALLELPFYCIADLLSPAFGYKSNGFSPVYHKVINVASVFYLLLGCCALYAVLIGFFTRYAALTAIIVLVMGTNLFYYSIEETAMSHVYSFCLFSIFLYLLQKNRGSESPLLITLLAFTGSLIILIRPTNVLFLLFAMLLFRNRSEIKRAVSLNLNPARLILIAAPVFIVFTPQLLYWKYLSGSFIHYSYTDEGFNFLKPEILKTWLAPNNGLLPYTPLFLLIIFSTILMIRNPSTRTNGILLSLLFLTLSYILSCWSSPSFGCSLGARSFVEYLAVFSLPLCYLLERVFNGKNNLTKASLGATLLLLIAFNLKLTYSYDKCFYGSHDWDWKWYKELVL